MDEKQLFEELGSLKEQIKQLNAHHHTVSNNMSNILGKLRKNIKEIKDITEKLATKEEHNKAHKEHLDLKYELDELSKTVADMELFIGGCRKRREAWDLVFKGLAIIKGNIAWIIASIAGIVAILKYLL
jgi:predicted  nucleic acid-binding Zn-ribbon protein